MKTQFSIIQKAPLYVIFLFITTLSCYSKTTLDSLLYELDQTIRNEQTYTAHKINYINSLKGKLSASALVDEDKYLLYQQLAKEYETFRCDTAILFSAERLVLAEKTRNANWINESKFQLAFTLSKASMFEKAIEVLNSIDKQILTPQQLVTYYKTFYNTYIFITEFYQHGYQIEELSRKREAYHDSLLLVLPPSTYEYAVNFGTKYIQRGEYDRAEELLFSYLPKVRPDTRDFGLYTSIIAYLYEGKDELEKRKEYLAMSAIADIKSANKENISLRFLADLIFQDGDIKRANVYVKKSMEDANYYNGRLRNIQTSRIFSIINEAYQLDRAWQQKKLSLLLLLAGFLVAILMLTFYFMIRQMKKLSKAKIEIMRINEQLNDLNNNLYEINQIQRETNRSLNDANHIKEQLISSFLDICTEYIDKLRRFKLSVNRKIKAGQVNDIIKMTNSTDQTVQELKELYANFDKAFLTIYPDFIKEFNQLLREEERYPEKEEEYLNQELRIFALVRLGITDRNKIATFLHYSLRTVYNYWHKIKSKAINQDDDFEEQVRLICSPES